MYAVFKKGNNQIDLKEIRCGFVVEIKLAQGVIHLWDLTNTVRKVPRFGLKSCLSC
jgi:hypothetical protein